MTLETVRESLLADTRAAAARVRSEAEAEAAERLAHARRCAEDLVEAARRDGAEDGRVDAALQVAVARVQARGQVLAARREAYDELRRAAREAAVGLRAGPGYDDLLQRLAAAARRDLGPDADVEIDPPDAGGVRAASGSRRVDYTLLALADRCIDDLGPALRRLWS
jgi:vacuolar-type H+-ATPase subunit E/Vma4